MSELIFAVDGHDTPVEVALITGLRRNSMHSTTVVLRDDNTIHVNEPFDSVYDRIREAAGAAL